MRTRRFLALAVVFALMTTLLTVGVLNVAAETVYDSSVAGEGVTVTLGDDGVLTVSGSGAMNNFGNSYGSYAPWYSVRGNITSVVVEDGITEIGNNAFLWCNKITSLKLPSTLKTIGEAAFRYAKLASLEIPVNVETIESLAFASNSLKYVSYGENTVVAEDAFSSNTFVESYGYTVNLDYQANTTNAVAKAYKYESFAEPSVPEREGYLFDGWYFDAEGTNAVTFPYKPASDNITLYAKWSVDESYNPDHTHIWEYSLEGTDTIKATCKNEDGGCGNTDGGSVRIAVADEAPAYTGEVLKPAKVVNGLKYTPDGFAVYYLQNGSAVEPVNVGTYTAVIEIEGVKVVAECSIVKGERTLVPAAPVMESFDETSLTLAQMDGCEYRIGDGEWQSSPVFSGLTEGTLYVFYARYAETDNQYASAESKASKYILGSSEKLDKELIITAVEDNDILVENVDYTYINNELKIMTTKAVEVSLHDGLSQTDHTIVINMTNGDADVTLNGVSIAVSEKNYGMEINGGKTCILRITGENSITSTHTYGTGIREYSNGGVGNADELVITSDTEGTFSINSTLEGITQYGLNPLNVTLKGNVNFSATSGDAVIDGKNILLGENAIVELSSNNDEYGIASTGSVEVGGNAQLTIKDVDDAIRNTNSDGTGKISFGGSAVVRISECATNGIYANKCDVEVKEQAKVYADGAKIGINIPFDSLSICDSATVEVKGNQSTSSKGISAGANVNIDGEAQVSVEGVGVGIAGTAIYIEESAMVSAKTVDGTLLSLKAISGECYVSPAEGKLYRITAGENVENAVTRNYDGEDAAVVLDGNENYFHAEAVDKPVCLSITETGVTVDYLKENAVLFVASYSGGRMIDCVSLDVAAALTQEKSFSEMTDFSIGDGYVKVFLLKDRAAFVPLCGAVSTEE